MPRLAELRQRFFGETPASIVPENTEEVFVSDTRSGLNSTQILENKFGRALLQEQLRQAASSLIIKPRPR